MRDNFNACLSEVLRHEGGYVDNPADPGGETNMGISKRSYPNEDIKGMTRQRAAQIYRRDYWNAVRGDDLPAGLDLVAFDGAVNSGVSRGAKWVQQAVGAQADGKIGPATLLRISNVPVVEAVNDACDERMRFLRSLKTWVTFGRGWQRRVDDVRATALKMAAAPVTSPRPPAKPLKPSGPTAIIIGGIFAAIVAAFAMLKG